jgi:starch phosphorylase
MMAYSIAINASFFNTRRMVQEYVLNAYLNL